MSIASEEGNRMTTTVEKSSAIRTPPAAAGSRLGYMRWRGLTVSAISLTFAGLAVGTWLTFAGGARQSAPPVRALTPAAAAWTPTPSPWVDQLGVIDLKKQLVRAGYQVTVDDTLDPVTKSALADYLQPGSVSSLGPALARGLRGTVILGRQNPVAWNSHFGLHRPTKFVERPLTGPGGQLDLNGNLRIP
jgi:hypothetical protein